MGQVVDVVLADALGPRIRFSDPVELVCVGRSLRTVPVDEIEEASADALDRRDVERLAAVLRIGRLRAKFDGAPVGAVGVDDPEGHRRRAWPMHLYKIGRVAAGLFVDDVVDVALPVDGDRLPLVTGNGNEAHQPEEAWEFLRLGVGVFDEFEAIGAGRVGRRNLRRRCVVGKGTHG